MRLTAVTWLVVTMLADGARRYTELAGLGRDGLISRTVYPVVPPRVDYALTDLGGSMLGLVSALERWAEEHIDQVAAARAAYDARDRG